MQRWHRRRRSKLPGYQSLTDALSSAAIAEDQGVQLAVDEINKSGGIARRQVELVICDTAGDPTKAVNFANQLVHSEKVDFVIGSVNSGVVGGEGTPDEVRSAKMMRRINLGG